ncbi:MAG: hypothetical protein HY648_03675 [Acidobacteria bacterium]|nr:hypothetical protein [Acidobacteriota bacterium]
MRRTVSMAALALLTVMPLVAQAPAGWKVRADRSTSVSDPDDAGDIKFMKMGTGFHAVNPQAAIYWNPANTASGNYSLKASFTLVKPSTHLEYYGLMFGGSDLEGPNQNYLYFLVAQNGSYLIRRRVGDAATEQVAGRTPNDAVKAPDDSGKSTNALEVRVMADKIDYIVNGKTVHSTPKTGLTEKTDGIYGFRINHRLEVHVDGLEVSKL